MEMLYVLYKTLWNVINIDNYMLEKFGTNPKMYVDVRKYLL